MRYIAHKMGYDSSDDDLEQPLPNAGAARGSGYQLEQMADSFGGESLPAPSSGTGRASQPGSRANSPAPGGSSAPRYAPLHRVVS